MPAIALSFVAAKAGCFIIGSLIHGAKELMKRFGVDNDDTAKASCLLLKDEQLGLRETPNESPSNALILYASREIIRSSNSRALAILSNDALALEAPFSVLENCSLPIMNRFNVFAAWAWFFRKRFSALMQSALSSVITDMKMAMSTFSGSASERVVEKKAAASISSLIQANSSRIMDRVIVILTEATRLLQSRSERNMSSTLLGEIFPAGVRGKDRCFDFLLDSVSFGDSITVDVGTCTYTQKYLAMVITCFKRAHEIISHYFTCLLRPLRLHGLKVTTLALLFVSISLIGWSILLMMIFEGCKIEQSFLQKPLMIPEAEAVLGVEAGAFSFILSDGTSNAFDLIESMGISNFDYLHSSLTLMATGANDGQVDLDLRRALADYTSGLHLWPAEDFSTTSTPELQTDFLWDDKARAASLDDWNIDTYHCIQSRSGYTVGFGTDLESSLFMQVRELVPGEDHVSNGIATGYFDGYSLTATIADEAFALWYISQALQNQSSVELDLGCPPSRSSASDGDTPTPTTSMLIFIQARPPQELLTINYLSREFDCSPDPDPTHVGGRCSDSTAVQMHNTHSGLDHPGSDMLLWSSNDLIAANLSGYFWNQKAAVSLRLVWSIDVFGRIQSESTPIICVLRNISSDRFGTSQIASIVVKVKDFGCCTVSVDETLTFTSSFVAQASKNQSSVESLGRSILSKSVSDANTLNMQKMAVAELGASDEISPVQCRDFDRTTALEATRSNPLLRLPAPTPKNRSRASISIRSRRRFSAAPPPSLKFGALEVSTPPDIFCELRQLAWILLMLAYCNSDGATKDDGVLLSSQSEISPGINLDLEEACDDEMIFADEENGADEALLRNTKSKPSGHELTALHSDLGRHWKSPSKRGCEGVRVIAADQNTLSRRGRNLEEGEHGWAVFDGGGNRSC